MSSWNQDTYIKAWNFASRIHSGQMIPRADIAYINHIGLVAMEALAAIAQDREIQNPNLLVQCALLHDSIEDTATTYDDVKKGFGEAVADGVLALTKNKALPSKAQQMADSLHRIKRQPKAVWTVKLCDRITNLQPPPDHWNRQKIANYRDEAGYILEQLGGANLLLAERLKHKIDNYGQYL